VSLLNLRPGDRVKLKTEKTEAVVVEVKTRSIVVRTGSSPDTFRERHVEPSEIERLPSTKEAMLAAAHPSSMRPVMVFQVDPARFISIDDAHIREDRTYAMLTALRTLYSELQQPGILQTVSLVGFHRRRVLTLSWITGHDVFAHMRSAWNDHRLYAEHRDIAEERTLDIFRAVRVNGQAEIDETDTYANAFLSVRAAPVDMSAFLKSAHSLLDTVDGPSGLKGAALFTNDDDSHAVLFTRFGDRHETEKFVHAARLHVVLPQTAHLGDEAEAFALATYVPDGTS
jgi:hypothetical protein